MQFHESGDLYILETPSGHLQELKNKGKVLLGNPKSGRDRLQEQSLMRAFHYKVEVTVQKGVSQRWL